MQEQPKEVHGLKMNTGTDILLKVIAPPEWKPGSDKTESESSEPSESSHSSLKDTSGPSSVSIPMVDGQGDAMEEDDSLLQAESAFTGFFRDGIKRIDLVLVIQDTGEGELEKIKIDYLLAALQMGLELELESGVETQHKNLIFVKVHAPDNIIYDYGHYFDIRKFFKDSHVELIKHEQKCSTLYLPFPGIKLERQMIKLVRNQYPGPRNYSPLERSKIVYRILLTVPFGNAQNYIGLQCLLENKIILDAYPLHDGPYYFLPEQDKSEPNGRQVLYHQWVGFSNLLKSEPVHMIREYFGERIGFFFSFYDFYTRALFVAGIIGLLTFIAGFGDKSDHVINKSACTSYTHIHESGNKYLDMPVCPKCRDFFACPFRNTTDYCTEVKLKNLIDNPYAIYYSLFIYIWAMLVVLIWRRKEHYLSWLWEESHDARLNAIRPEYRACRSKKSKKKLLFLSMYLLSIAATIALLFLYCLVAIPILISLYYTFMKITVKLFGLGMYWTYVIHAVVAVINAILIMSVEKVCKRVSYYFLRFMNHRTEDIYEKALVVKWFGLSFINKFTLFFYVGFVKGSAYTYPNNNIRWNNLFGFGIINCGLLSCIDELWIVYTFTTVSTYIFQKFLDFLNTSTTDYNRGRSVNQNVPCWEKEYSLIPLNDDFIMQKYKDLIMQFAVSTMFVTVMPLAPLIAFLTNLWDLRSCAQLLIQRCRRPLITKSWGLGGWFIILHILPFIISMCNSMNVALNYNWSDKYIHEKYFEDTRFFQDFFLDYFETSDYGKDNDDGQKRAFKEYYDQVWSVDFCLFPGKYRYINNGYKVSPVKVVVLWYKILFVIVYQQLTIVLAALLYYFIQANPGNIEEARSIETTVRNYAMRHEGDKKSK